MNIERTLIQQFVDAGFPKEQIEHNGTDFFIDVTTITTSVLDEWCEKHHVSKNIKFPKCWDSKQNKYVYRCELQDSPSF